MTDYGYMGVAFHIAAFLITMTCIVYTYIQNRVDKPQKKMYLWMLIILVLNTVTETVYEVAFSHHADSSAIPVILTLCKYVYFISHTAVLPILGYYGLSITGRLRRFSKLGYTLFGLPVLFIEALMITNPIHLWCFSFGKVPFEYQRGWGVTALYVISAFYIIFFIANLFGSWKAITKKRRIALVYFLLMVFVGIILQMIHSSIRIELFAESVAYLGLLLTVENEDDLIDGDVGLYNRKALKIDIDTYITNDQNFHVACVKVENSDIVRRVTGSANTEILSDLMYRELVKYVPRYSIYKTAPDTFVIILMNESAAEATAFAEKLSERFDEAWTVQHTDVLSPPR